MYSETSPLYINEQDSDLMGHSDPVQRCVNPWLSSLDPCRNLPAAQNDLHWTKGRCFRDAVIACSVHNPVLGIYPSKALDTSAAIKKTYFLNHLI